MLYLPLSTIALSGADSEETRADAIERLTMDVRSEKDDYLDYQKKNLYTTHYQEQLLIYSEN